MQIAPWACVSKGLGACEMTIGACQISIEVCPLTLMRRYLRRTVGAITDPPTSGLTGNNLFHLSEFQRKRLRNRNRIISAYMAPSSAQHRKESRSIFLVNATAEINGINFLGVKFSIGKSWRFVWTPLRDYSPLLLVCPADVLGESQSLKVGDIYRAQAARRINPLLFCGSSLFRVGKIMRV